jgi:hypothetical protein
MIQIGLKIEWAAILSLNNVNQVCRGLKKNVEITITIKDAKNAYYDAFNTNHGKEVISTR